MTDIIAKLDAIEAGLEGVTPGPWRAAPWGNRVPPHEVMNVIMPAIEQVFPDFLCADAAHIARLDPDTIKELVRLARIGAEAEWEMKTVKELVQLAKAQEPLGAEFEAVLDANKERLYEP